MLRKIWRNPQAVIGLGLIVLICAVAILAPLLAPHAPDEVNPLMKYQAPSADYPLGTDQLGRCELSRLLYGARASLGLALPILILLGGIGLILGMMTACIGGWFDRVVTGISQVFIAFPTLIIAVAIIGVLEMACKILFGRLSSPCGRGLCSLFAPMPKRNLGGITLSPRGCPAVECGSLLFTI